MSKSIPKSTELNSAVTLSAEWDRVKSSDNEDEFEEDVDSNNETSNNSNNSNNEREDSLAEAIKQEQSDPDLGKFNHIKKPQSPQNKTKNSNTQHNTFENTSNNPNNTNDSQNNEHNEHNAKLEAKKSKLAIVSNFASHLSPLSNNTNNSNNSNSSGSGIGRTGTLNSAEWLQKMVDDIKGIHGLGLDVVELDSDNGNNTYSFVPNANRFDNLETLFTMIACIGTGATSRVVLAENNETHERVALKQLRKDDEYNLDIFNNEYKILSKLNHSNIAGLRDCYIDKYNYYIATPYCSGGALLDYMKEHSKSHTFTEMEVSKYVKTIINAIDYCHSLNIVHRDLKPGNLMFDKPPKLQKNENFGNFDFSTKNGKNGKNANKNEAGNTGAREEEEEEENDANLLIIDFGIAIEIEDFETEDEYIGTVLYMPPESVRERQGWELKKGDLWSIGVITYILVCGIHPFIGNNHQTTLVKIMNDELKFPKNINLSADCKDFISKLLNKNTKERLSAKEALEHKWIKNVVVSSPVAKGLGEAYKSNLDKIDRTLSFEYLVQNATLSQMDSDEKNLVIAGLDALEEHNEGEISRKIIFEYLCKIGMTKEEAVKRANVVNKMAGMSRLGHIEHRDFIRVATDFGGGEVIKTKLSLRPKIDSEDNTGSTNSKGNGNGKNKKNAKNRQKTKNKNRNKTNRKQKSIFSCFCCNSSSRQD